MVKPPMLALDLIKTFDKLILMKKTFLVMVSGYWGRGQSLKEAALQCERAGGRRMDTAVATLVIGDNTACINGLSIEYAQGSEVIELGKGYRLGHFLNLKD